MACDGCGKRLTEVVSVELPVNTCADGSGAKQVITADADLCIDCLYAFTRLLCAVGSGDCLENFVRYYPVAFTIG